MLWRWPPPHGRGVKDWIWIWSSENLLKSNKTDTFRAWKGCALTTSSLRSLLLPVLPPHSEHIYIDAFQTCILALAVPYASSLVTAAEHIYVKMLWSWQSSHGRGLKSWLWVWDSEQLIRSIGTSMFYRNVSNYHLIIVVTPTDTRRGHMVFPIKLSIITDRDV